MTLTRRRLFASLFAAPVALKAIAAPVPLARQCKVIDHLTPLVVAPPPISKEIIEDALRWLGIIGPGQCASATEFDYVSRVGYRVAQSFPQSFFVRGYERFLVKAIAREIAPAYNLRVVNNQWVERFL